MSKPLTDQERKAWRQTCLVADGPGPNRACNLRFGCLRYEATLQAKDDALAAKDEQITALVDGILDIHEWMSGRGAHICPFCKGTIGDHGDDCLRTLAIAIKEAIR